MITIIIKVDLKSESLLLWLWPIKYLVYQLAHRSHKLNQNLSPSREAVEPGARCKSFAGEEAFV